MSSNSSKLTHDFLKLDLEAEIQSFLNPKNNLESQGFTNALDLFRKASQRVPAYKDFLKKHKIDPQKINTPEDFKKIPIIDKKNYLRAYDLKDLCWDGKLDDLYILSSSSGSTGEPFLWPRGEEQELEGGLNFEVIFKELFQADKYKTLYIICFAMGTWISGPFVLACAEYLSKKGYPLLSITPGLQSEIIFSLFKKLAPQFDQIVISGYPPFIKDLIDTGKYHDINWKKHRIRFLFAAEGFSEKWRDYVHLKAGIKNPLFGSVNIYGSADAAILAHETPLTTTIRRLVSDKPRLSNLLFQDSRLPTLAQYDPRLKYMEEVDRRVIFTTRAGIPLIRYSIGDTGGVYSYAQMSDQLQNLGIDIKSHIETMGEKRYLWRLPFVYVFGRTDLTVSLYGLLIYPEHIKYGIERSNCQKEVTGKFIMSIEYDEKHNPFLLIRLELAKEIKPSANLERKIKLAIVNGLKKVNSEYSRLTDAVKDRAFPVIEFLENGYADYFKPGMKQKWVKKD